MIPIIKIAKRLERAQAGSLGYVLIRSGQLFNELGIQRVNAEAGKPVLSEAHTRLLPYLQSPGGIRVTELARKIGVTKQAVAQLIATMVEHGVVRLEQDPRDARARRVMLTERGYASMLHGTEHLRAIDGEVSARLGKRTVSQLHGLLTQLLQVLQ